jgi:hypothetical protein
VRDNPRYRDEDQPSDPLASAPVVTEFTRADWASFCRHVSDFINASCDHFSADGGYEVVRGEAVQGKPQLSISATILVPLTTGRPRQPRYRARLRLDMHTETFGVTLAIDDIKQDNRQPLNAAVYAVLAGKPGADIGALYDDLWNDVTQPLKKWVQSLDLLARETNAQKFCEFRGVVIPAHWPGHDRAGERVVRDSRERDLVHRISNRKPLTDEVSWFWRVRRDLVDRVMAFGHRGTNPTDKPSENVVCSMLDGQVLYAAPLVHWGNRTNEPIRYLAAYGLDPETDAVADRDGDINSQLGRFVRRLHVMGELRHSAMLDYDRGQNADDLKRASKQLTLQGRKFDGLISDDKVAVERLKEFNTGLTDLHRHADGGLPYRIEQSRYYAATFRERIKDLRVGRIEGQQPYDEFVRRNSYQVFAKIDQIGKRYDALGRRIDRWTFLLSAESSSKFNDSMTTAAADMRLTMAELKEVQKDAKHLLSTAEKFATLFLVYYIGHIVGEYVHTNFPTVGHFYEWVWLFVLVVFVIDVTGGQSILSRALVCGVTAFSEWIVKLVLKPFGKSLENRNRDTAK